MQYLKKTYQSFVFLTIGICFISAFISTKENWAASGLMTKVLFLLWLLYLNLTALIIYRKEYIYWITSYDYKTAAAMPQEQRKKIGKKFLIVFSAASVVFFLYACIGFMIGTSILLDVSVFTIVLIGACCVKF